ncbi:hypothetical protein GC197_13460 [bacterium]|nr:hypothetical protein [bacterium]
MNRANPLIYFFVPQFGIDALVASALYWQPLGEKGSALPAAFLGILMGQFGLCCAWRLRSKASLVVFYLMILGLAVAAMAVVSTFERFEGAVFGVLMIGVLLAFYCLGPVSLWRWLAAHRTGQFSLREILVSTAVVALLCMAAASGPFLFAVAVQVLLLAVPTIVASLLIATIESPVLYAYWMFLVGAISLLFGAGLAQGDPGFLLFFLAQSTIVWLGGLQLISMIPDLPAVKTEEQVS